MIAVKIARNKSIVCNECINPTTLNLVPTYHLQSAATKIEHQFISATNTCWFPHTIAIPNTFTTIVPIANSSLWHLMEAKSMQHTPTILYVSYTTYSELHLIFVV